MQLRDLNNSIRWSNMYLIGFSLRDNGENMKEAIFKEIIAEDFPELLKGTNPKTRFKPNKFQIG